MIVVLSLMAEGWSGETIDQDTADKLLPELHDRIGLTRPYWAITTSYLVAQPLAGAVLSKAVFRVAGTVLGATAAVVLVPAFVNEPVALSLALALWLGVCLYFSLLDRTPRAYIFLLAGYTASIIGFPSVETPGEIFNVSILRVQEIREPGGGSGAHAERMAPPHGFPQYGVGRAGTTPPRPRTLCRPDPTVCSSPHQHRANLTGRCKFQPACRRNLHYKPRPSPWFGDHFNFPFVQFQDPVCK